MRFWACSCFEISHIFHFFYFERNYGRVATGRGRFRGPEHGAPALDENGTPSGPRNLHFFSWARGDPCSKKKSWKKNYFQKNFFCFILLILACTTCSTKNLPGLWCLKESLAKTSQKPWKMAIRGPAGTPLTGSRFSGLPWIMAWFLTRWSTAPQWQNSWSHADTGTAEIEISWYHLWVSACFEVQWWRHCFQKCLVQSLPMYTGFMLPRIPDWKNG